MACPYSKAPVEALCRIFFRSSSLAHRSHPPQVLPATHPNWSQTYFTSASHLSHLPVFQKRYFRHPKQYAQPVAIEVEDHPPRDEAIASQYINLVSEDGVFHPAQRLHRVLQSFDRKTHVLQMVMPANPNLPRDDRNHLPICKIFTKFELAQSLRKKEQSVAQNAKKVRKLETGAKTLEFSWAIGENDLAHRMKRAREFLDQGRRLDITLLKKKGTREVTPKECRRLIDAIEGELEQVPGAKQRKESEGQPGRTMTLFWEGTESAKVKEKPESQS